MLLLVVAAAFAVVVATIAVIGVVAVAAIAVIVVVATIAVVVIVESSPRQSRCKGMLLPALFGLEVASAVG